MEKNDKKTFLENWRKRQGPNANAEVKPKRVAGPGKRMGRPPGDTPPAEFFAARLKNTTVNALSTIATHTGERGGISLQMRAALEVIERTITAPTPALSDDTMSQLHQAIESLQIPAGFAHGVLLEIGAGLLGQMAKNANGTVEIKTADAEQQQPMTPQEAEQARIQQAIQRHAEKPGFTLQGRGPIVREMKT